MYPEEVYQGSDLPPREDARRQLHATRDAPSRDSWYEAAAGPPRQRGDTRCSTTIYALTV